MKIVSVAFKVKEGLILSIPAPARHHNIFRALEANDFPILRELEVQGFLLEDGNWISREDARKLAEETGQVTEFHTSFHLFSEDLW